MQFVDIKNDIAFRKIFGNENKKVILISFLNAILHLDGDNRIQHISISNPFQPPILPNYKASILDVRAKDFKGDTFIVEMQVIDVLGMDKRLLYYTSKEYAGQLVSGEKYTELNPVIFIGIFDFKFTKGQAYLSHHAICDVVTQERVIKDMDFYFIELPKFLKPAKNLDNITDKWIYFIKEAENIDLVPENVDDEGLKEAYADANKNTWTKDELDSYDYAAMREQDNRGMIQKAELIAEEKGQEKKIIEIVIEMYKNGLDDELIAKIAKIDLMRVQEIIKNL